MKQSNKSIIVYFSAAGTTKKIAECIKDILVTYKHDVRMINISDYINDGKIDLPKNLLQKGDGLWILSPVYAGHAVPPVEAFISQLDEVTDTYAMPIVTYGTVSSGIALSEMAEQLSQKGLIILGAAKILTVHSLLWFSDNPLGKDHPDANDEKMVKTLVDAVLNKINNYESSSCLSLEQLNYQSLEYQAFAKSWDMKSLKQHMPPITLDEEKCTECQLCAEKCPMKNITFNPLPQLGDHCVFCFNCIRNCEFDALNNASLSVLEDMIHKRAAEYKEPVETKIFI
jgi:ferredoxin/flavodoxin